MKRLKKVFSSHTQLCHVWAQQSQPEGRASRMFFTNTTDIYSYGMHYLAARIHTVKGKKFALVRSDSASISTSGHLRDIRHALQGLMPYFNAPNITNPKEALKHLDALAQESITNALKRSKVDSQSSLQWRFAAIREAFGEANKLRKILGRAEKFATTKQLDQVETHLKARLKRYRELNTPEMIEKKAAEKNKRDARKAAAELKRQAENIARFRAGESVNLYSLPYEILRLSGDTIKTSKGAEVPLDHAKALYSAIQSGRDVSGQRIGHFRVDSVTKAGDDSVIKIGCHKILLSEAAYFFEPKLSLAKGA